MTITRQKPGQPTGGQFSAHTHDDSAVDLDCRQTTGILGYTYKADNYQPAGLIEVMISDGSMSPGARGMNIEEALDQVAGANGFDREDEYSFDSDEFPKVVTEDQVSIADAQWLGREFWNFGDYGDEPKTADDALDEFAQSLELPEGDTEELWEGTDYSESPAFNLNVIARNANALGLDLEKLGYPLPTRHNAPADEAPADATIGTRRFSTEANDWYLKTGDDTWRVEDGDFTLSDADV